MLKNSIKIFLSYLVVAAIAGYGIAVAGAPVMADRGNTGYRYYTDTNTTQSDYLSSSYNWAGYIATGGTYTGVNGTWTVPQVKAADNTSADVTWVGIGGAGTRDLIQAGTQAITDPAGGVNYQAWYELLPGTTVPVPVAVKAGDSITTTITNQPDSDYWTISLKNNTNGQSFEKTVRYASSRSAADWIEEMPLSNFGYLNLSDFGQVDFTDGWAIKDGVKVNIADAGAHAVTMNNMIGDALATPTSVGTDGASFSVARTDAASTPAYRTIYVRTYTQSFGRSHHGYRGNNNRYRD